MHAKLFAVHIACHRVGQDERIAVGEQRGVVPTVVIALRIQVGDVARKAQPADTLQPEDIHRKGVVAPRFIYGMEATAQELGVHRGAGERVNGVERQRSRVRCTRKSIVKEVDFLGIGAVGKRYSVCRLGMDGTRHRTE